MESYDTKYSLYLTMCMLIVKSISGMLGFKIILILSATYINKYLNTS